MTRDFRPQDQEAVRALILSGMREHWGEVDTSFNADLDDIAGTHARGRTVVVEQDGEIVGTGTLLPRQESTAEIVRMSVAATSRRSGIGRIMVDELVATAERWGCHRVILETTASWDGVIDFYRSCGFVVTHLADGEFGRDVWFERIL